MVIKANFRKFRVSEFIQFFTDTLRLCRTNKLASAQVEEQLKTFSASARVLENSFKVKQASEITAKLSELDRERDQCIICLRKLADAYTDHYKNDLKLAGEIILQAIDKYGTRIYNMNYQAETSTLSNLCEDLTTDPKLAEVVNVVGHSDLVNEMNRLNKEFNKLYLARVTENSSDESINSGEAIKQAIFDYRLLISHIEAHSIISPSEDNSKLIAELNTLIDAYNILVEQRNGRKAETDDNKESVNLS